MTLNNTELKDDGVYFNGTNAWGQINDYALSEDNDFSIKIKFTLLVWQEKPFLNKYIIYDRDIKQEIEMSSVFLYRKI